MEKKVKSKWMEAILQQLNDQEFFQIVVFTEEQLLNEPVSSWGKVDCFITFFSNGFPLEKVCQYVSLHKHEMFVVNNLTDSRMLLDRRWIYAEARAHNLPVAPHVVLSRDSMPSYPATPPGQFLSFEERRDSIIVNGVELMKPFVEKPVDSENHNIYIYYHSSTGGGVRKLFRKTGNKSSDFDPRTNSVRNDGNSYIYEQYLDTSQEFNGQKLKQDVKTYAVGVGYCHAECRKSPVVDGLVMRNPDGKEVRWDAKLNADEMDIASCVVRVFNQRVCGFDLLRCGSRSYICDVNGWSFVKGHPEYYDNCSRILRKLFLDFSKARQRQIRFWTEHKNRKLIGTIAVFRHGDRTPKQKVKFKCEFDILKSLFAGDGSKEVKLKSDTKARILRNLESIFRESLRTAEANGKLDGFQCDSKPVELCCQVLSAMYPGTKVQLKPVTGKSAISLSGSVDRPKQWVLVVCKWGGALTEMGKDQAYETGEKYRKFLLGKWGEAKVNEILDGKSSSFEVETNIERRVRHTAEYFSMGFLGNPKSDVPSEDLSKRIRDNEKLLGIVGDARDLIEKMKTKISRLLHREEMTDAVHRHLTNCGVRRLEVLGEMNDEWNPLIDMLDEIYNMMACLVRHLQKKMEQDENGKNIMLANKETLFMMYLRWKRLYEAFFSESNQKFDTSKIPDVYDYIKYDVIHNKNDVMPIAVPLFFKARALADFVVPREYGITPEEKSEIGQGITRHLMDDILFHIENMIKGRGEKVKLYFSSESHVHPLYNVVANSNVFATRQSKVGELNYLTQVIFNVYEDEDISKEYADRFYIQLQFSSGMIDDAFATDRSNFLPVVAPYCLRNDVSLQQLQDTMRYTHGRLDTMTEF